MLSWTVRWIFIGSLVVAITLTVLLVVFLGNDDVTDDYDLIVIGTSVGQIQGRKASDRDYYEFLGVPYAQVNASNPFGASRPYPNFENTFVADDNSAVCPQISNGAPVGVLDCLHLNIIMPESASDTNRLPVMVWIHGGAFENGSKSRYGAKFLVRHDVIFVAINYRLGAYGFMCLDTPEVPGNQGLKDQVLALRWVRDNIEAFGGDVNRITAFGFSAGGHSIDFHILSDTEPLFKNAILQSGSSLAKTVFTEHIKTAPIDIAAHLGFNTNSLNEALEYLSTADLNSVVRAKSELGMVFKPCTEMQFNGVEAFLTRPWVDADKPKANGMPILAGYTEQELLLSYVDEENFENYSAIQDNLQQTFNFNADRLNSMEKNIRNFYFGDREVTFDWMWPAINFDSDYTYIHPIHRSINKYLASEAESVFLYVLSYNGDRNLAKVAAGVTIGSAAHGDDLGYLFDIASLPETPTTADQLILDRMTTMWTNFAKYSDPTPETTDLLPVRWPAITDSAYNFLTIDTEMVIGRRPTHRRMAFWDLFYKYNGNYHKEISNLSSQAK